MTGVRVLVISGALALVASLLPTSQVAASGQVAVRDTGGQLTVAVPAGRGSPGYRLAIDKVTLGVRTERGGRTVLATNPAGGFRFSTAAGQQHATNVTSWTFTDGTLRLTAASTAPGSTVSLALKPAADRYDLDWSVTGTTAGARDVSYQLSSAGHWYGGGETSEGASQPYPLDAGSVSEPEFSPASYLMMEPYWYTSSAVGYHVRTDLPMDVGINKASSGVGDFTIKATDSYAATVFVESTPSAVYQDYISVVGKPAKSDATATEFAKPLWNSWAQFYTAIDQNKVLDWAGKLHAAGLDGHTVQLDDKWESNYGNLTFDPKTFPNPKHMSDQIHAMGSNFGLWTTLWINLDSVNYAYAADHGYLLADGADQSKPCTVSWWNGRAGIVDLGKPAARDWYVGNLHKLMSAYGVDGFKFDTRFFDDSCAPAAGVKASDYQRLGAEMADGFDLQGAGVRVHWGSQKYGFVIRAVDAGTSFPELRTTLRRSMAISTNGYPFVETDMIGGSLSQPAPTKQVLVRWAQAASLMPLMYSSTSPLGVIDKTTGKPVTYDAETVQLYKNAIARHGRLSNYLQAQVQKSVADGTPIIRPVFFDFPADRRFYSTDDEWMLGPAVLAAPVLTDSATRTIDLPAGVWFDTVTHRVLTGPRTLPSYPTPLGVTPTFVRLGAPGAASAIAALS